MSRNLAVLTLALAALLVSPGCKKLSFGKKTADATAAVAPGQASAALANGNGAVPEPPKPDLTLATPVPRPKPAVNQNASVMVLCYHNIDEHGSKAMTIPVSEFEKEMQQLKDSGFSVIGMQDFLAWRRGEKSIPSKSCVITLDDGWISGYTNAWPILKKYGYPFTMFIYINYVGTGGKSVSWEQLEEMRDAGVDIQSHTYSHANLRAPTTGVDKHTLGLIQKDIATLGQDGWMRKEIIESKKVLEQRLGIKVNALAYPFGNYNPKARALVKEAGYEAAFTVYGQRLSMHSPDFDILGRYAVEVGKPKIFEDALAMIGGGTGGVESASENSVMGQLAVTSMITQPMNNETVQTTTPLIKANLSTMGDVEPGSVLLRLSGVGQLPVNFDVATKMMTCQVTKPLKPGDYTVIVGANVNGQRAETKWMFTVAGAPGAVQATPDPATTEPEAAATPTKGKAGAAKPATPKKKK